MVVRKAEFVAIPLLKFDPTAKPAVEARRDQGKDLAGADAEPIPEIGFDQTLWWKSRTIEMALAAGCRQMWSRRWRGALNVSGYQLWLL